MKWFKRKQRGQASVDLVASLVLFAIMLSSLVSISLFLYTSQAMSTAAAVGGRTASTNPKLADSNTYSQGVAEVRQQVKDFMKSSTGTTLQDNQITVTGPTGTTGNRNVTLKITQTVSSPIKVQSMMYAMSHPGQTPPAGSDTFAIQSQSTFHYED